jgi:hypothetical protein
MDKDRTNPVRQTWEYKVINGTRVTNAVEGTEKFRRADSWSWFENGKEVSFDMNQLGGQGWDLVSAIPISSWAGRWQVNGESSNYAGFTTDITYTFKRLKP